MLARVFGVKNPFSAILCPDLSPAPSRSALTLNFTFGATKTYLNVLCTN